VRAQWGINEDQTLIGLVARLDPMKDLETFLGAAALLGTRDARLHFVCVGGGSGNYADAMRALAASLGLDACLRWVAERADTPAVYSALDVLCSSSRSEGFSNVIAEAMACERVVVVTDVGDSRWIVGDAGQVVPLRDAAAFAEACQRAALLNATARQTVGRTARARIENLFNIGRLLEQTETASDLQ
jgi:glycosyltransferase involved in cell wall biosynthesis